MFGRFRLAADPNSALVPHGATTVSESRTGQATSIAQFNYETNGTTSKVTQVGGTVPFGSWEAGGDPTAYWIYGAVTVNVGTGLHSGTANTWQQLNAQRFFGVQAGPGLGYDDEQVHVDVFIQASASNPGTTPSIASPQGSIYMGTLNLHATSQV